MVNFEISNLNINHEIKEIGFEDLILTCKLLSISIFSDIIELFVL